MSIVNLPNNWKPRDYQEPLWQFFKNGGTHAIAIAHRRWGKDDLALHHTACAAHERIGNYGHCLPEYSQARKAIWDAVNPHTGKRRIDEAFPHEIRNSTNDQKMFIRFKCGSTWQVLGSDQYDRLVGTAYAGIIFSEWALANPAAWGFVQPILAENNGWALFITTPRGKNHAEKMYKMAKNDPKWFAQISTISDTKRMDVETLNSARKELIALYGEDAGEAQFKQEYYCSFDAAILGAFYGKEMYQAEQSGRITKVDYDPSFPVCTAWDIGSTDDTAIWFYQVIANEIRIIDYYFNNHQGAPHYADHLLSKSYKYGTHWLPHDAVAKTFTSQRSAQEQLADKLGWQNLRITPNLSRQDGRQAVRLMLPKCWFDSEKCSEAIEALKQYQRKWDDERKCFINEHRHDWTSHPADAFRYLAVSYQEEYKSQNQQTVTKDYGLTFVNGSIVEESNDENWKLA
jgi:phage terminase large subunit